MRPSVALGAFLLAGCSIYSPHVPVGPEEGYCYSSQRTARAPGGDGCPRGSTRHRAWVGERETGLHMDEALAFLRDRRREMVQREAESARLSAVTRTGAVGGVLLALGGGLFGASRDLIAGAGLGGGASYTLQQGFAPQSVRDVYNAGAAALSCIEARALSARIAPVTGAAAERRAVLDKVIAVEEAVGAIERFAPRNPGTGAPLAPAASTIGLLQEDTRRATTQARTALTNLDGGALSGPLIANAVYDRTMAILFQVNSEVDRATPNTAAIMDLARSATGSSLNGIADTVQALSESARAVRDARRNRAEVTADPAAALAPSVPAAADAGTTVEAARRSADGRDVQTAASALETQLRALEQQLERLQAKVGDLGAQGLVRVRACSFQQNEGQGLTLSADPETSIGPNGSVVFTAAGGRPPYRIQRIGQATSLVAEPELSTGPFAIRASGARAGTSATFMVGDSASASAAIVVRVGAATTERSDNRGGGAGPQVASAGPGQPLRRPNAVEQAANDCIASTYGDKARRASLLAELTSMGHVTEAQIAAFMRDATAQPARVTLAAKLCPTTPDPATPPAAGG